MMKLVLHAIGLLGIPLLTIASWRIEEGPSGLAQGSAPEVLACVPDVYEPDDACIASISVIHGGETQNHNFCEDADDWVAFSACAGRAYSIRTLGLGPLADTLLELYQSDCTSLIASNDNGGGGLASRVDWVAPADGVYHVRVRQVGGSSGDQRTYTLSLSGDTSACRGWVRQFSTNGCIGTTRGEAVQQTSDGGFIVTGSTPCFGNQHDPQMVVLKLDAQGAVQWQKRYGSVGESARAIQQLSDGGYFLAGVASSFGAGNDDFWALRLGPLGQIVWQKTYGGFAYDDLYAALALPSGSFVLAGLTGSFGNGGSDGWIVQVDSSGEFQWQKVYGGDENDAFLSLDAKADGTLVLAGYTDRTMQGYGDLWVVEVDGSGNLVRQSSFGGQWNEEANSIRATADGGAIVAGFTENFGAGEQDAWVIKLDSIGDITWQFKYGAGSSERATRIVQRRQDGGYVFGGAYTSAPYTWLVGLDPAGQVQWESLFGESGFNTDPLLDLRQNADGGFIACGSGGFGGAPGTSVVVIKTDESGHFGDGLCCPYTLPDTGYVAAATDAPRVSTSAAAATTTATRSITGISSFNTTFSTTEQCGGTGAPLPLEVSRAGAAGRLRFASPTTLTWEDKAISRSDFFDLYRGDLPVPYLGNGGSCLVSCIAASSTDDFDAPTAGWFYLIGGRNLRGAGPMGTTTNGTPRVPTAMCP